MKLAVGLLAFAAAMPSTQYFKYERPLTGITQTGVETCVPLDASVFAHASPQLADLRVFHGGTEMPFAIREATPARAAAQSILPLNLGTQGNDTVFDAAMPRASYGDVELAIAAQNFIATVTVTGSRMQGDARATKLGAFTIFDLTRQRLGRSTVLHLPRSDFRYLHFRINGTIAPASITGLSLLRLPQEEPTYATVAQSIQVNSENRRTIVDFAVLAHVPVDRVSFTPGPEPRSFSRDVTISVLPTNPQSEADDAEPPQPITFSGTVIRLHTVEDGQKIDEERLTLDTPYGEQERPSKWTVNIENGDDAPLPLSSVRLEMLERDVCFEAGSRNGYTLFYGDPMLPAPRYDYAALHASAKASAAAVAGAEQLNGEYRSRPDARPFTERHPALLWTALVGVILLLGGIALRSNHKASSPPS